MPDRVRISLLSAASRAAACGRPLDERDGLAILLEALRFSARRGVSVADGALCIDADGKLSFRPGSPDSARRDPGAQVDAACALADALFRGNPPLPLEPATFPTLEHMIVAAELRVLRSGEAQLATHSEARRAAAALFASASEAAENAPAAASEVITDKLPIPEAAGDPPPEPDEPLLAEIPGLSERDLHREGTIPEPRPHGELERMSAAPALEVAPSRDIPEPSAPAAFSDVPIRRPAPPASFHAPTAVDPPARSSGARGQWMLPTALLLATASAFPFGRRTSVPARPTPPEPVPASRQDDAKASGATSRLPSLPLARAPLAENPPVAPPATATGRGPVRGRSRSAVEKLEEGERALAAGRYFQAIIAFRDVLDGPAPLPRAARRLGDVYLLQDEPEQAAAAYRQYLQLDSAAGDASEIEQVLSELEEH